VRTVTYQSVLDGAMKRRGITPVQAQAERLQQFAEFIADKLRDAWEFYAWPETMLTEQRRFRAEWVAQIYASGVEVYHTGTDAYWISNAATTALEVPGVSTKWVKPTTLRLLVGYEQTGLSAIDAVLGAWDADPEADPEANSVPYTLAEDGVLLAPDYDGTAVWLRFRTRPDDFAWSEVWDETIPYDAGAVVYYAPHVYTATVATATAEEPGDSANWRQLEFPYRLARAVKAGAASEDQGAGGQEDKELVSSSEFTELLEEQVWQLTKLQGQTGRPDYRPGS
jgi:hypothetical protein